MELAIQGGTVIAVLFMFVALFLSLKTWKFFHVFMLFWVFAASIVFVAYSAMVTKTHLVWKKTLKERQEDLEKAEAEVVLLRDGGPAGIKNPLELSLDEHYILSAREELLRVRFERGGVWRNCQVINAAAASIQLNTNPAPPDPAGAAPPKNRLKVNDKLTAYKEDFVPAASDQWKVPIAFLGEFRVTAATDTTVTLVPVLPMDPQQIAHVNAPSGTWVLYERMPIDSHRAYEGLDQAALEAAIPRTKPLGADPVYDAVYAEMITNFLYDLKPMTEVQNAIPGFDPPPGRHWVRVKFKKPPEGAVPANPKDSKVVFEVEVNAEATVGTMLSGEEFYDLEGRWRDANYHQKDDAGAGYPTQFREDDIAVFDKATADQLISEGRADVVDRLFVRELVDYEYSFHDIERQKLLLTSKVADITKDIADLEKAIDKVNVQIAARNDEIAKLNSDKGNHEQETRQVTDHVNKLTGQWATLQKDIVELHRANRHYATEIAMMQKKLKDEIEQRVREATAAGGD